MANDVGFFAIQPFDTAGSPRRFYYISVLFMHAHIHLQSLSIHPTILEDFIHIKLFSLV
jgi:hypothetical protein